MTKAIDFEKSLKRLEKIVQDLEVGNLSLDEALKKYEEGIELARNCSKLLKDSKMKVEKLVKKEGNFISEEFESKEDSQDVLGED
ncbi:MAG: exodeoxyribonuclease VII small subunit [Candidatus Omnitrophica bacterium]|nr:exodeoxyribonuclease VII small subunit [Candidatus Omnitrophota bacterium]MBU1871484.1 exodeoxyribonuclease VII small subunit [Candidatus Omnitrophota bacterium]